MKLLIQRVKQAKVEVEGQIVGQIDHGLLGFLGVLKEDTEADIDFLIKKVSELRIFSDEGQNMNLSIQDVQGSFLIVSQFTLAGNCRKGRRPSFDAAAPPAEAEALYEKFVAKLRAFSDLPVETGQFQAMMNVSLVNDGPVTLMLESK